MSNNYDESNIATMEMIYGEGYLSAGGDREVARIFSGVKVAGKSVLDVGCGLGGAAVSIARDLDAGHVHGVDIDQGVLSRAAQLVEKNNVGNTVTLCHIEPGPLPFPDQHFDLVHLTAVACHFEELDTLFDDIFRVLKPGGCLVGRDWMKIGDTPEYRKWDNMLRNKGLNFYFADETRFSRSFVRAGFSEIIFTDRTGEIAEMAVSSVLSVESELRSSLIEVLGDDGYRECLSWAEIRANALARGGIGQSQFSATRPV